MADILDSHLALEEEAPVLDFESCSGCGGPLEWGDRFCAHCGASRPVAAESATAPGTRSIRCESCGAEVAVDYDCRSYCCAFCGSNYVVELPPEQSGRQTPEFVLGFAVTREDAMERFRRWLGRNSWFCPRDLKSARIEGKLAGVYLPFWAFSMLATSRWDASIGEHWYRTETYTTTENGKTVTKTRRVQETEWWPLSGGHHRYYSMYLVPGGHSLCQRETDQIQPVHLAALKRYDPRYLAGWVSEEYTIEPEEALETCKAEFARREEKNVAAFLPGDTRRNLSVQTCFSHIQSDLILLPVYLLSYQYRGRLYRFLLNGQTGKAAGTKPVSGWRVGLTVLGIVAAVVALLLIAALASGV